LKQWFIVGLVILFGACVACDTQNQSTVAAATPPHPETPTIPTQSVSDNIFVASGPVVVENQVDVAALRDGLVVDISVQPGDRVRQGQLLAKLDDRQISADVEAAAAKVRAIEANLENWKAETKALQVDLWRAQQLWQAEVIPKEELEHAEYKEKADEYEVQRESESLNNARDVQKSLELEKDKTRITAPFDGVIARRYVRVGQKVSVGDRLFWVTAMSPLEVKFTLPERLLRQLNPGAEVELTSTDIPAELTYSAKVIQVSPVVDPSSGTFEVLARVADPAPQLRPGMLMNIRINLPR
jgi:membrane fusion protein, multidrug efflux system